ncbi:MAG: HD-GYP domain-containing protein [Catonella sp.]|uniref:HD-GYP domain-containing protein n=1 Tax=Catonella sp. TaxID=2382125 RepID=UPI003FA171E2
MGKADMSCKTSHEIILEIDLDDLVKHGIVVSNLAEMVTRELGFQDAFVDKMAQAGLLHDIGKLRIANYLYGRQNGELKVEEIKYVRMHSVLSYGILKKQGYEHVILDAVLYHHENYDGSGYPNNLKGENIPIGARILRICDVFGALVAHRPYRDAFLPDKAIRLMINEIKNFDMECFLALQRIVNSKRFDKLAGIIEDNKKSSNNIYQKTEMNLDLW